MVDIFIDLPDQMVIDEERRWQREIKQNKNTFTMDPDEGFEEEEVCDDAEE